MKLSAKSFVPGCILVNNKSNKNIIKNMWFLLCIVSALKSAVRVQLYLCL